MFCAVGAPHLLLPPCHSAAPQVHMLLLAHLAREEIPLVLRRDLHFLLTKCLPMLQEMLGLATVPRVKVGCNGMSLNWAGRGLGAVPAGNTEIH